MTGTATAVTTTVRNPQRATPGAQRASTKREEQTKTERNIAKRTSTAQRNDKQRAYGVGAVGRKEEVSKEYGMYERHRKRKGYAAHGKKV